MPHIMPDLDFYRRYLAPDLPQEDFLGRGLALLGRRGPVVGKHLYRVSQDDHDVTLKILL